MTREAPTPVVVLPRGGRARLQRIERHLKKLMHGVVTDEQCDAAMNRVWRYYEHIPREDQRVMLALMMRNLMLPYYRAERLRHYRLLP